MCGDRGLTMTMIIPLTKLSPSQLFNVIQPRKRGSPESAVVLLAGRVNLDSFEFFVKSFS